MIVIRLAGGLGNQIFQLGAGLLLAQNMNTKKIILDDSALNNYDAKRENELLNFFDLSKLDLEVKFKNIAITKLRIPKLFSLKFSNYPFVSDKNFQNALEKPNKYFMLVDGYFQECLTQEIFDEEIKILSQILIRKNSTLKKGCIIHIRGGDFVKFNLNYSTPKEYYIKAIREIQNICKQNNFYIITDDEKYSETLLNGLNIEYTYIGNNIYDDFHSLGNYNYRIISSSSFIFWATALSANNSESITLAPDLWPRVFNKSLRREIYLINEKRLQV